MSEAQTVSYITTNEQGEYSNLIYKRGYNLKSSRFLYSSGPQKFSRLVYWWFQMQVSTK